MEIPSSQPLNLCYCYAYEDRKDAQKLDNHLTALKTSGVIQACYGCAFYLDGSWEQEAADHIKTAHLVLLLISAQFHSFEEMYRREIAFALERHDRGDARVIPIRLSDVDLEGTYLSELRMLPNNREFISGSRDKSHVYAEIARTIRQIAVEMRDALPKQTEHSHQKTPVLATAPSDLLSSLNEQPSFLSICWFPQMAWLATGTTDGSMLLYNMANYDDRYPLLGHEGGVYSVAWSTNNQLASGSVDCTVRLWNASERGVIQILQGHTGIVNTVAWSPDGKQVASGSADKTLHLWDAGSGCKLRVLTGHTQSIMSVAWSPDGKLLAAGARDWTVRLWEAKSGRELRPRPFEHQADVMSVAWSPNSNVLATGSGYDVRLWDASTGCVLSLLQGHTSTVTAVAWSPDGKLLASSSRDQTVCLWDPFLGKRLRSLQGHMKGIIGITWSPDGRTLATVSYDEFSLWNTETGELIATLDSQRSLRTIIRQPERTLRVDTLPYDDGDAEEFQQQERTVQEQKTLQEKPTLICPYCYKPFPEKRVHNRRKRGLTEIVCDFCKTCVSLLASQEQSGDNVMSESVQAANGESPHQRVQAILRRKTDTQAFDVFFCYNHQDKPVVKHIGEQLKRHGILPWLDEWELRPGDPWQKALEEQIRKTKLAIIFVGSRGMGPWHDSEIYAILRQMKMRDCRVIPVWLPGAPERLELSLFLEEMFWVDFRLQEPDPMRQLLWGITGQK
jgi:WD40 repeat protein